MHWLDLVIVAIVAWFTFSAFSAGLIRELVTIIAVIAGAVLAGRFYAELALDIEFLIDDESTRNFIAFVAIFAGVVVLGQIGAAMLRRVAAMLLLGPFDHIGGALFGFAKGAALVQILLIVASVYPFSGEVDRALERSTLAPLFLDRVPVMLRLLPDEFSDALDALERAAGQAPGPPAQ